MKILGKIPRNHFHVSVSGGSDSMTLIDFLRKYPKNSFDVLYFNHGTEHGNEAQEFLIRKCKEFALPLTIGKIPRSKLPIESPEEFWRKERYKFLSNFSDEPILMAHHLDDVFETYIMTALKGKPQIIPYCNPKYNIIRPFILVTKDKINEWIKRHNVEYIDDPSNKNVSYPRNFIRHHMHYEVKFINPGIYTVLSKLVKKNFDRSTINI